MDGEPAEPLAVMRESPFSAAFVSRVRPEAGEADSGVLVVRERWVGRGMREDFKLRNMTREAVPLSLSLLVECDFAHLFDVKEGRSRADGEVTSETGLGSLTYTHVSYDLRQSLGVRVGEEASLSEGRVHFKVVVPAKGEWSACVEVVPSLDGSEAEPRYHCGDPVELSEPVQRMRSWRRNAPSIRSENEGFDQVFAQSEMDLGALRIFDAEHPSEVCVAAGAPWFMTIFGRDCLLASWMSLIVDPRLAAGTLSALARRQGTKVDPITEEEPGRILHELRWGLGEGDRGSQEAYYGSIDSTPLFVMLLGELRRWGLASDIVARLMPAADNALRWIADYGDRDGDGFVEYRRATSKGLVNQGWKDSVDGINFATGRLAEAPIALCEVQGYVYAAYIARAHFAREAGDQELFGHYTSEAMKLKRRFNERFWLEDRGYFAIGLDAEKNPIDSCASNVGQCLWTGIVDEAKAPLVARKLLSKEMFTGYGLRTLSSDMGAYNPMSYHNGSVWPHDSVLAASGLMRYGFVAEARRILSGLLEAAVAFGGRLPELFCGFDRSEMPMPVPYPTACSPQAWAAAAPYQALRSLLRLDPWVPRLKTWIAPVLPPQYSNLVIEGVTMADARVRIAVEQGKTTVEGLPRDMEVIHEPRSPLAASH